MKLQCQTVRRQCRREAGRPVQITGARRSGRGPGGPEGLNYVAYVFVFLGSRLYKLTLSDEVNVALQLRVSVSGSV